MIFKEVFDLYKKDGRGKEMIDLFSWEQEFLVPFKIERLIDKLDKHGFSTSFAEEVCSSFDSLHTDFIDRGEELPGWLTGIFDGETPSREAFADYIDNLELPRWDHDDSGVMLLRKGGFRNMAAMMPYISTWLYLTEYDRAYDYGRGFFKPIMLPLRHDQFQRNCQALGISLPPLPAPTDHRGCCLHYYDICATIYEFQKVHGLTDAETCAAVYDFALIMRDGKIEPSELPEPTNVWLTGASGEDFKYLDALGSNRDDINPANIWACNERTRRGDIVVIMCLSPRSSIHSIWRADTAGIFNPFDYYHCRTTVCNGIIVPPIKSKELKADTYFSQLPIVRKNFQGINGWELTAKDYSELLRMIEEHGGDTSALPRLFDGSAMDFGSIQNEHDVEENILIPALRRLGYSESDWTRQLRLKAGRGHREIPDFVFFAKGEQHFENAPMVIEAKFDMSSMTEFRNAYRQALSYARMLRSSIMGLCDKERIVIYHVDKNGTSDISTPLFESHWAKVFGNEEEGARLKQIIGRVVIAPRQ